MPGSVLIVDGVATNRIVLKVKLASAFYTVLQAATAKEALAIIAAQAPDLIIVGDTLPGQGALALCAAIKAGPGGRHLPVVLLTSDRDRALRVQALTAGVDEVLCRPVDDLIMLARLRSLIRARLCEQELRLRDGTERALGFAEQAPGFDRPGKVAVIDSSPQRGAARARKLDAALPHDVRFVTEQEAIRGDHPACDVYVIALPDTDPETGLGILSDLRSRLATRQAGIIVAVPEGARRAAANALDLGANDLIIGAVEADELALRLGAQIRTKRNTDRLRDRLEDGMKAAVTDPLTGLYNRRYALPHLRRILEKSHASGRLCAVMVADLDHFKQINDRYGHAAGDAVLIEVARRLRDNLRAVDLVARTGGEEFLIVMPETRRDAARAAADRLRRLVGEVPIVLPGQQGVVTVTVSIGVTLTGAHLPEGATVCDDATVTALLERADKALYGAKEHGRDRVTLCRNAA